MDSIVLYHNVWYHILVVHHGQSCHVVSYHIISYHIISYHIISMWPWVHWTNIHVEMMHLFMLYLALSHSFAFKTHHKRCIRCGVRVLGFELRVQWHRHISLSAASNEFCKFVSLKSCRMWRSNTSNGWCWAHLEWAKQLRKWYSEMIEAEINSNQEGFKVPAFGWHPPQPFMLKYPPKWKWVHPSRRWA